MTPYSAVQWRAIGTLARRVDADLDALDARLTQGGEPTFVAATGGEAPEDRKSTRLNSSHIQKSRMPSSA